MTSFLIELSLQASLLAVMKKREMHANNPLVYPRNISTADINSVAVLGVLLPSNLHEIHEQKCTVALVQEAAEFCSHDIGPTGFLEAENATVLNDAILRTA